MIAQVEIPPWVAIVTIVIGGGGVAAAIGAIIKARPEASKILIGAAEDVVIIQRGTITDLKSEVAELRTGLSEMWKLRGRVTDLEQALHEEERRNQKLREENGQLKGRIEALEKANGDQ